MEKLTWELVVLLMGGLITVLSFLYNIQKKESANDSGKIDVRSATVERDSAVINERISNILKDIEEIKRSIDKNDQRTKETLSKLENSVGKLTDNIIDLIQSKSS